jgi:hypothetical protein
MNFDIKMASVWFLSECITKQPDLSPHLRKMRLILSASQGKMAVISWYDGTWQK